MKIGLYDVDSSNFPNLPLMKLSAYHKSIGDDVEMLNNLDVYDKVYVSKVFGSEYSQIDLTCIQSDEIVYGGTGFAIKIVDGKEVYDKSKDIDLPYDVEHTYPDYSLYPKFKDTAYGFLTRGCCNDCSFCIVSKKEGLCSKKVADLNEFWNGQKSIKLLDANLLACKDNLELLEQLADSGAYLYFTQGLDARFITKEACEILKRIKFKAVHFAFDFMKNEKKVLQGLEMFVKEMEFKDTRSTCDVYVLTNYDTTIEQDLYRVKKIQEIGLSPYVMIYRKKTAPQILKDLQRWSNNRFIYRSCEFMEYVPRVDGRSVQQLYSEQYAMA